MMVMTFIDLCGGYKTVSNSICSGFIKINQAYSIISHRQIETFYSNYNAGPLLEVLLEVITVQSIVKIMKSIFC